MWTSFETIANGIAQLFHPLVEVGLFDLANKQWRVIHNRLSNLQPLYAEPSVEESVVSLGDGRMAKQLTLPLKDPKGKTFATMRLLFETTTFQRLQDQLASFLTDLQPEGESKNWKDRLHEVIEETLKERKVTVQGASRRDKQEVVLALYQAGLFDYKDAASQIAEILQTSRATIYNYLKWATTLQRIQIHQVDAFAEERFGGNPAGVVLDAEKLTDEMMRKITREMNLSETAFVLPSETGDFRLRYFTPSGDEVRFCGHSTVGALHMLAQERRFGLPQEGTHSFDVETLAGLIHMEVCLKEGEPESVAFEAPLIDLVPAPFSHEKLCQAMGISPEVVDQSKPVMLERTNQDLFLTIRSLEALQGLTIDVRQLTQFAKQHKIVAFALVTPEAIEPRNHLHVRSFAPGVGIPEDPFCGSILGGLAAYAHQFKLVNTKLRELGVEQGYVLDRPGTVRLRIDQIVPTYHVTVLARAIHFFSTQVEL